MEYLSRWARENPDKGVRIVHLNTGQRAVDGKRFHRLRDEMWAKKGRGFFSDSRCSLPNLPGLLSEICAPSYFEDGARMIRVESKKEVLQRTGQPSGNRADAILHTLMVQSERTEERTEKSHDPVPAIFKRHFQRWRQQRQGEITQLIQ
jgi:hypothetical protein